MASDTPQVSLLTTVPATAGMISVSLNRTTHSSENPTSIEYYNTLNEDNVMSVSSWTENL